MRNKQRHRRAAERKLQELAQQSDSSDEVPSALRKRKRRAPERQAIIFAQPKTRIGEYGTIIIVSDSEKGGKTNFSEKQ
jgi:L-lactate utilization protein LutC